MDRETFLNVERRAKAAGLKRRELLRKAGVSYSTWTRWKSGQIGPQMRSWTRILTALDEAERMAASTVKASEIRQTTQEKAA